MLHSVKIMEHIKCFYCRARRYYAPFEYMEQSDFISPRAANSEYRASKTVSTRSGENAMRYLDKFGFAKCCLLYSASDSAFRCERNIAVRGDTTLPSNTGNNQISFLPERQTLNTEHQRLFLPVAQLDSASDSDSEGRRFESYRVGHQRAIKKISPKKALIFKAFLLFSGEIFMFDFVDEKWVFSNTKRI